MPTPLRACLAVILLFVAGCGNLADLGDPEMARSRRLCASIFEPDEIPGYIYAVELDFERGASEVVQVASAMAVCDTYPPALIDDCSACALAVIQMVANRQ